MLALALAATPAAAAKMAVPDLDFTDTSGEPGVSDDSHAARLAAFAERLRSELAAKGVDVVMPACTGPCTPATTPFAEMEKAAREAGAALLLVGGLHKMSSLIGMGKLTLIDLDKGTVVCDRLLTYRGDTDEAFDRAARFAAKDVLAHCPH